MSEISKSAGVPVDYSLSLQLFFLLQVLDVVTTLNGFQKGLGEASPFIRFLMHLGPIAGLMGSKIVAVALGAVCVGCGRLRLISFINYWFAALVTWNLALIVTH